jgi:hypothetical protein
MSGLVSQPSPALDHLTSVGAPHVMGLNKKQKTQNIIVQGGFDAGA